MFIITNIASALLLTLPQNLIHIVCLKTFYFRYSLYFCKLGVLQVTTIVEQKNQPKSGQPVTKGLRLLTKKVVDKEVKLYNKL